MKEQPHHPHIVLWHVIIRVEYFYIKIRWLRDVIKWPSEVYKNGVFEAFFYIVNIMITNYLSAVFPPNCTFSKIGGKFLEVFGSFFCSGRFLLPEITPLDCIGDREQIPKSLRPFREKIVGFWEKKGGIGSNYLARFMLLRTSCPRSPRFARRVLILRSCSYTFIICA